MLYVVPATQYVLRALTNPLNLNSCSLLKHGTY
jgi:hypothetical protein